MVAADDVVGVTGEEDVAISGPAEGDALNGKSLGVGLLLGELLLGEGNLVNLELGLEVPDDNAGSGSSAEPVAGRREDKSVDGISGIENGEVLALVEVPEHGGTVFATRGAERSIRGNGNGVDVRGVANQVSAELAVADGEDLDDLVPASRNEEGSHVGVGGRGEADAGDPLLVAVLVGAEGVLALANSVPELDGLVARTRDDLAVVLREGNGQNILGVANEAGGLVLLEVPETEGAVPRAGEDVVAVGGDGDILDEVGVAGETLLGKAEGVGLRGLADKGPDDDGLVTGGRDHDIGGVGVGRGSDGSDPTVVADKAAAKRETLRSRHLAGRT